MAKFIHNCSLFIHCVNYMLTNYDYACHLLYCEHGVIVPSIVDVIVLWNLYAIEHGLMMMC